jgi:hypothetical protein
MLIRIQPSPRPRRRGRTRSSNWLVNTLIPFFVYPSRSCKGLCFPVNFLISRFSFATANSSETYIRSRFETRMSLIRGSALVSGLSQLSAGLTTLLICLVYSLPASWRPDGISCKFIAACGHPTESKFSGRVLLCLRGIPGEPTWKAYADVEPYSPFWVARMIFLSIKLTVITMSTQMMPLILER